KNYELHCFQARSMTNLHFLIKRGLIPIHYVISVYENAYLPRLKAITYGYSSIDNRLTICSHAPCGLNTIKALAKDFGVDFNKSTVKNFMSTIDSINQAFSQ